MFTVIVMPQARRQMDSILLWWRGHRPEAPDRAAQELRAVMQGLRQFPDRGVSVTHGRRRLVTQTSRHVVFYRVRQRAKIVEIIEVRPP